MENLQLNQVQYFLLDLDGTFYLGDRLLPGAKEIVDLFHARNLGFLFLTNNSSRHRIDYAKKLKMLGIDVPETQIFTSGEATAWFLHQDRPGCKVFLAGTHALEMEFEDWGFQLVQDKPDVVVLGFDTRFTYGKLWRLCNHVRSGITYLATHPDPNCPTEDGLMPDIGATIAFVETSTGRRPDFIIGKPHRPIVEAISHRLNLPLASLCMVGDYLDTDIALGQWGIATVLVLSGETREADLSNSPHRPDFVVRDLAELCVHLQRQT